jgi:peroxiredoxin-like protein
MEAHHEYRIDILVTGPRKGVVHAAKISPSLSFSAPPEFQGEAGYWTPEHFLVASVGTCFASTFSGIAEKSKFQYVSFHMESEGELGAADGGLRFTEIRLRPTVMVMREGDRAMALRLVEKAEKSCLIARSLSCNIAVTATIKVEEELIVPAIARDAKPMPA